MARTTLVTTGTIGRQLKTHIPREIARQLGLPHGGGVAYLRSAAGDLVLRRVENVQQPARVRSRKSQK
jgi:hypothetical protein